MAEFQTFAKQVHQRYLQLAKGELFITVEDGSELYEQYLRAFPEGTNPIYKERTEHDCSCCKNFIRNIGKVVAIVDGKLQSVWAVEGAEYPYNLVAAALDAYVVSRPILGLFRSSENMYGAPSSKQLLESGAVKTWNHFHGNVGKLHFTKMVDQVRGNYATTAQVFRRGLEELLSTALESVLELIENKMLYRGEEHLPALKDFYKSKREYMLLDEAGKNLFVWVNADSPASRFRNTVIGTLVQDLSEGRTLEAAVKSFEVKVAPTNYKRPTALITPRMVEEALKKVEELKLRDALERRFAKISDISVNNVLWVDNSVSSKMRDGLEQLLMDSAKVPVRETKAEEITIDEFMTKVLPLAHSIEMLVKGAHVNNLMTLTAPMHDDSGNLFKWNNGFGWSYNGNIADSDIRKAVQARGGKVDGVFRFSHSWNYDKRNTSLMDLHVFMPGNSMTADNVTNDSYGNNKERVGWNSRGHAKSGGVQDVDYVNAAPVGYVPVENITFPDLKRMPEGRYICKIHNWDLRQPTEAGFRAEIEFEGKVFQYEYPRALKHKEWVTVAEVTLKDGKFSINHHLKPECSSKEVWGIKTETFVKVATLLHSPNHWDDQAIGNKHYFFILDGCKTDEAVRGIYNEFLNGKLEEHRKVFEILGDKTKCKPTEEQLSGLGFSSTRNEIVTVMVKGPKLNKSYNIKF